MEKVFHTVWHGAAYYPELWKERIDEDIRLMQEAGINMVRVAEFAWSSMEPEEGRYDWGWLRRHQRRSSPRWRGECACVWGDGGGGAGVKGLAPPPEGGG